MAVYIAKVAEPETGEPETDVDVDIDVDIDIDTPPSA